jgi:hypothetical protein
MAALNHKNGSANYDGPGQNGPQVRKAHPAARHLVCWLAGVRQDAMIGGGT